LVDQQSQLRQPLPALHALLEDDLVVVEILSRQDKPPRRICTIREKERLSAEADRGDLAALMV
jgi:hypothetical protein